MLYVSYDLKVLYKNLCVLTKTQKKIKKLALFDQFLYNIPYSICIVLTYY
ncbi:hypothetical protein [Candidatus Hartigia pinicola]